MYCAGSGPRNDDAGTSILAEPSRAGRILASFPIGLSSGSVSLGIPSLIWDGQEPPIALLATGQRPLMGTALLKGRRLTIDFQLAPWEFDPKQAMNLKGTFRRVSFLTTRLLANQGVPNSTPLLARFSAPAGPAKKRRLTGFYLATPEEWDDPYRFFGW